MQNNGYPILQSLDTSSNNYTTQTIVSIDSLRQVLQTKYQFIINIDSQNSPLINYRVACGAIESPTIDANISTTHLGSHAVCSFQFTCNITNIAVSPSYYAIGN